LIPATDNRTDRSPPGDIPDRSSPSRSSASEGPRHRRQPEPARHRGGHAPRGGRTRLGS